MKQAIFSGSLVFALVTTMCAPSIAGNYDEFIHFVNHRDANGNLVVPQHATSSQPHSVPKSNVSSYAEVTPQTPTAPQPVSQVLPSPEVQPAPVVNATADYMTTPETHVSPEAASQVQPVPEIQLAPDSSMTANSEIIPQAPIMEESSNDETTGVMKKTVIPAQPQTYVFRNTNWGMSLSEVKAKEIADFSWELDAPVLMAGEHRLGYQMQVKGIETSLTYAFENDHLMNAKYVFETDYVKNDAQPMVNYKIIKNWLIQKYGQPQSEENLWMDELYLYAPELWGRALMRGHLTIVDEWDVDGTSIVLLLNGGDETVGLMAEFTTKNPVSSTELVRLPPSFMNVESYLPLIKS